MMMMKSPIAIKMGEKMMMMMMMKGKRGGTKLHSAVGGEENRFDIYPHMTKSTQPAPNILRPRDPVPT